MNHYYIEVTTENGNVVDVNWRGPGSTGNGYDVQKHDNLFDLLGVVGVDIAAEERMRYRQLERPTPTLEDRVHLFYKRVRNAEDPDGSWSSDHLGILAEFLTDLGYDINEPIEEISERSPTHSS